MEEVASTTTENTGTESTRIPLYRTETEHSNSGSGGTDETSSPRRTRRTRSDAGTARNPGGTTPRTRRTTKRARMVSASQEQIDSLAQSLSISLKTTFRVPAFVRSNQWGQVQTETGTVEMAGDFWLLSDEEAVQLGEAWAKVIVLYAPEEAVAGTAVIATALLATGVTIIPRVVMDVERKTQFIAMKEAQNAANVVEPEQDAGFTLGNGIDRESVAAD
jgi:hypothetical protein